VRHASHARTETDNILVRCVLADGKEGWGECVPREYVTGETAESALALLRKSDLSPQLEPCGDFGGAVALAENLRLAPLENDDRGVGSNAARCAVELAVLDAYGRHFGEPLSTVTKMLTPELYEFRPEVRYSGAITGSTGLKLRLAAWAYRLTGFRQIKVKVGIEGQDDRRRLRAIRRRVGRKIELRIDANEAWSAAEAGDRIRDLEPFGIASIEQPVPHSHVASLRDVRERISTPVMLDESLCSLADAERAVAGGWCDRFNLRLSKCGGFIPTLRVAEFAHRNQIQCQLGCQVGESAILSSAGRQFAVSVGGLTALEGSFDRHLVAEPLGWEDITFGFGGRAPALSGAGRGAAINPECVERVTVAKEALIG
jgi:muconate cycloisomerase